MARRSISRRGRGHKRSAWPLATLPLAAAAGWIAYSRLMIDHDRALPPPLPVDPYDLDTPAGRISVSAVDRESGTPLLLVHSINAAGSAYEVRPLFEHYVGTRPVYAVDLPGFGLSDRSDRLYTSRLMADAIHAVVAHIRARHAGAAIDAIGLSLSCEYLARAALERPDDYRSLGLISPTGFDGSLSGEGRAQTDRGNRLGLALLSVRAWSRPLFDLVVSRPSMRYFLGKAWGSPRIDEGLLAYDEHTTHRPGAEHAAWCFLSGFLFADDISRVYRLLTLPVWAVHGRRGDFVDYRHEGEVEDKPNWTFDRFDTGAFPQFEALDAVTRSYDAFLKRLTKRRHKAESMLS